MTTYRIEIENGQGLPPSTVHSRLSEYTAIVLYFDVVQQRRLERGEREPLVRINRESDGRSMYVRPPETPAGTWTLEA